MACATNPFANEWQVIDALDQVHVLGDTAGQRVAREGANQSASCTSAELRPSRCCIVQRLTVVVTEPTHGNTQHAFDRGDRRNDAQDVAVGDLRDGGDMEAVRPLGDRGDGPLRLHQLRQLLGAQVLAVARGRWRRDGPEGVLDGQ